MLPLLWIVYASLVPRGDAQGSLGGQQYPPCSTAAGQASQYYGCWNISPSLNAGQAFYNLSIVGTAASTAYYPGWVSPGGLYDDSVNPANCTIACRGHGYKFSALYNGQFCYCGSYPPTISAPLSSLDPYDTTGNSCHRPGTVCYGDASQFCGAKDVSNPNIYYADVYVDNSFPLSVNPSVEQNNYLYYGCFHGTTFEYIPNNAISSSFMTAQQCFYECSSMGFPLAQIAGGAYSNCQCGTELPQGNQVADSNCKSNCATGTNCNPLTGTICCGRNGNNPVYIDTNLVGCYQPSNPGTAGMVSYSEPTNAPTTIGMKTTASYPGPVVVATNPPSAPPYLPGYPSFPLKGCFNRGGGGAIVSGFSYTDSNGMTVDSCLRFCSQYAFYYLSVEGGNTCACSIIALSIVATQVATENCHILCPGNSAPNVYEYCGGLNYEQIYGNFLNPFVSSIAQSGTTTTTTTTIKTTTSSTTITSTSKSTTSSSSSTIKSTSSTSSSLMGSLSTSLTSPSSSISPSYTTSSSFPSSSSSSGSSTSSSFPTSSSSSISSSSLISSSSVISSTSSLSSSGSSSSVTSSASSISSSSPSSSSLSSALGSTSSLALSSSSSSSNSPASSSLTISSSSSSGFTTVTSTTITSSTSGILSSSVSLISSSQASSISASLPSVTSLVENPTSTIIKSIQVSGSIDTSSATGLPSSTLEVSTSSGSSVTNSELSASTASFSISTSTSGVSITLSKLSSIQLSTTQNLGSSSSSLSLVHSISNTAMASETSNIVSTAASSSLKTSTAIGVSTIEIGSGINTLKTGASSSVGSSFATVPGATTSETVISGAPSTSRISEAVSLVISNSHTSLIVQTSGNTGILRSEPSETQTTLSETTVLGMASTGNAASITTTPLGELSGVSNPGTIIISGALSSESSTPNSAAISTVTSPTNKLSIATSGGSNSEPSAINSAAGTASASHTASSTSNLAASITGESNSDISTRSSIAPQTITSTSNLQSSPIASSISAPQFILQINPTSGVSHNLTRRNYKRQTDPGYLGSGSSAATKSCSSALPFMLLNEELSINGQLVSTDPGVPFQLLAGSPVVLGITRAFSIVNGTLVWQSSAFVDNFAYFCQVASGEIYVEFAGPSDPAYPFDCGTVSLTAIPASYCQSGVIVYPTASYSQTGIPTAPPTRTNIESMPVIPPTQTDTGNMQTLASIQSSDGLGCKVVPQGFYRNGTEPIPLEECLEYTFTSYIGSCTYEALPTAPYG